MRCIPSAMNPSQRHILHSWEFWDRFILFNSLYMLIVCPFIEPVDFVCCKTIKSSLSSLLYEAIWWYYLSILLFSKCMIPFRLPSRFLHPLRNQRLPSFLLTGRQPRTQKEKSITTTLLQGNVD